MSVKDVAERAAEAFWKAVGEAYPQATTGDFSPGDTDAFTRACEEAVRAWRFYNVAPITILQLAEHRLGRPARSGADFEEAQLPIMGGCEACGASVAAYNSCPSTTGNLRCQECIGELGYDTVQEADEAIFGARCKHCNEPHERVPEDLCDAARREYDASEAFAKSLGLQ